MAHDDSHTERTGSVADRVCGFVDRLGSVLDLRAAADSASRTTRR